MHIEPSDIDRLIQAVVNGIVRGITRIAEIAYEWYCKQQAPYYIPPPEVYQSPYEDKPEAVYPEMEQKEDEERL
jgi:hypothetical protein